MNRHYLTGCRTGCSVGAVASDNLLQPGALNRAHHNLYHSIGVGMVYDYTDPSGSPAPMDPREGLYCYAERYNGEPLAFWLRDERLARQWLAGTPHKMAYATVLDCRGGLPPRMLDTWKDPAAYQVGADNPAPPQHKVSAGAALGMTLGTVAILGVLIAEGKPWKRR